MWFHILGQLQGHRDGLDVELGPPQQRAVLGVLIAAGGKPVSSSTLVDVLWEGAPPSAPAVTIQQYVSRLRRLLDPRYSARDRAGIIRRVPGGYQLVVDETEVDLLRWRRLVGQARQIAAAGDGHAAGAMFLEALTLWSGPVVSDLPPEVRGHAIFAALGHEHVAVLSEAADLALAAGGVEALVEALDRAAAWYPFDEGLHAHVLRLLAAAGRRAEALNRFQKIRNLLVRELGIEPGPLLQQAHQWVLDPGTGLVGARDEVVRPPTSGVGVGRSLPRPAQLPHDLPVFVGRSAELATVEAQVHAGQLLFITAIGGMAGIGKTSLALHFAHLVAEQFPDGQLYANLRGFDPGDEAAHPSEVLRSFLEALGVPAGAIPQDLDTQAALFRSKLAGRRFLLLLDNARDTEQVGPLLPGTPTSMVVVTSRDQLTGLVVSHGARPIVLAAMPDNESRQLLSVRLGDERMLTEPEAVDEILSVCAGLPIGLTIVAAHAATHPDIRLSEISAGLRDTTRRLDTLSIGDAHSDIRAVFSWSYRQLAPEPARLFRLLGLHMAPDISVNAAASLAGVTPRTVRALFADLVGAALLTKQPGDRYAMHDLLRAYAAEIAEQTEPEQSRRQALDRILDHYAQTAYAADRLMNPTRQPLPMETPLEGVTVPDLTNRGDAVAWFSAEHRVLRLAIGSAETHGFDTCVWQLGWSLVDFQMARGDWIDQVDVQAAVARSRQRAGDLAGVAQARRMRAYALTRLSRFDEAVNDLDVSLRLCRQLGNAGGEGYAHLALGMVYDQRQLHHEALSSAERAADLFERAGDKRAMANALSAAGWEHAQLGDYERALDLCRQALPVFETVGDRGGQSNTWDSLGFAHQKLGQHQEALECFSRSLEIVRDIGDRYGEATALSHRGDAYAAVSDHPMARRAWQQALVILEELDHEDAESVREKIASSEGGGVFHNDVGGGTDAGSPGGSHLG